MMSIPCPLHSKLGCLLFSMGSSNSSTTLHGGGGGGRARFPLLKSVKRKKAQFRANVSTHFVTDCSSKSYESVGRSVNSYI